MALAISLFCLLQLIMFLTPLFLLICVSASNSARILCAFPIPSVSHLAFHQTICKELSLRGHQVTVLTAVPLNDQSLVNLTEIKIENLQEITSRNYKNIYKMFKHSYELSACSFFAKHFGELAEEMIMKSKVVFPEDTNFDLLVVEGVHSLICSLSCRFKAPTVALNSLVLARFSLDSLGNTQHPLVFYERPQNVDSEVGTYEKMCRLVNSEVTRIFYHWYALPIIDKTSKKLFGETCPYIKDLHKNVSLVVANTNPILGAVRPNVAAVIEVGGFVHIRPNMSLPKDLQNYLDKSTQGFVYFSLGSVVKTSSLSGSLINTIIQALAELPYNVLWKWEDDDLPKRPKNVMIRKWFPQQDILGHKNIKVFITQGGLQSIEEAIANCVPLVAIAFYADQPFNTVQIVQLRIAQSLDYSTLTKDSLKEAIIEVAENDKYRKTIEEVKKLIEDRPLQSLEKAIWWIEYVLRHKGAKYLKGVTADISWFEYFMLDLIALTVLVGTVVVLLFYSVRLGIRTTVKLS